ncbi:MAG: glycosyltransferase family 39 protein [Nanoarchaeota archaeon]
MKEIKNIIEKNINYILYAIVIFGATLRFYFLNIAKNQAHWWDSLAYGSLAKNIIYHMWDNLPFIVNESIIRPPLFPLIWSFILRLGGSDYSVILITNIIPSIISIFLVYLIGKEMYGAKVGIIASIFASACWIHLFYAVRAMTDIPSMCLILASIYFFIKSHDSLSIKNWTLSVLFLALAVLFRYSHAVIAFAYVLFLIFIHKTSLFKNKKFFIGGVIGAIPLILFIIINLINHGSLLPASATYASSAGEKAVFAWYTLGFIKHILRSPLVYLFYAGLILVVTKLSISYGFISKNKESKMHLFNLILFVLVLSFFIFVIKAAEDRYLFGLSSILFILPALTLSYVYNTLSKYRKEFAAIVCLILIIWSAYANITFANSMILDKKESYKQMKEAYEWINYNTPENSIITGDWAEPYTIYYANRRFQVLPQDLDFTNFSLEADYVVLNGIHQPNEKVVNYVNSIVADGKLVPVKVFFFDAEQKQPAVIIYKRV